MQPVKGEKRKRSKAFYRKCAYGGKKQRLNANVLEPGIKGFLVMCNNNEKSAVRESYNILNEYADILFGNREQNVAGHSTTQSESDDDENSDEDVEKVLKKEVEGMKNVPSSEKRFQNVMTKAKNCVFIRTTLQDPMKIVSFFMDDIAQKKLRRARFAARILPIIGTCKADTCEIEKLALEVLPPIFSSSTEDVPKSFTIIFKSRNNNGTRCGKEGIISSLIRIVKDINSDVQFTWSDYSVAVLVEIVCTVCCLGVAHDYIRLRKYNLQELSKGAMSLNPESSNDQKLGSEECKDTEISNTDPGVKDNGNGSASKEESEEYKSTEISNVETEEKDSENSCEVKLELKDCNQTEISNMESDVKGNENSCELNLCSEEIVANSIEEKEIKAGEEKLTPVADEGEVKEASDTSIV